LVVTSEPATLESQSRALKTWTIA